MADLTWMFITGFIIGFVAGYYFGRYRRSEVLA